MKTLVRWHPTKSLFSDFDRIFDTVPAYRRPVSTNWALAVDVMENEEGYLVTAAVPGINPDELEISLEDDVLSIKGEIEVAEENESEIYHVRERRTGTFSRSIRFPTDVNADAVEASYEFGVLTLNVPKAEAVKPKRIAVKVS